MANGLQLPQIQPVDLGRVLGTATKIKALQAQENALSQRNAARGLVDPALQGDQNALRRLMSADVGTGTKVAGELRAQAGERRTQQESQREQFKFVTETTERLLGYVEDGATPDEKAARYQIALARAEQLNLPLEGVPDDYDPEFVRAELALARAFEDPEEMTSTMRNVAAATGAKPGTPEFRQAMLAEVERGEPLVEIADPSSPTGTSFVRRTEAVGQPGKPASGLSFESTPGGGFKLVQGRGAGGELQKSTLGAVEKDIVALQDRAARLRATVETFDPQFLEIAGKAAASAARIKDKLGVASASEKETIRETAVFMRRAFEDANQTINDLSGAAVSPDEAKRLVRGLPNPGTGILNGDSPEEFRAKMLDTQTLVDAAIARKQALLELGLTGEITPQIARRMPLEQFVEISGPEVPETEALDLGNAGEEQRGFEGPLKDMTDEEILRQLNIPR